MSTAVFTPYSTAVKLFGQKPSWVQNLLDQQRLQAYTLYEEIYWTAPNTFKVSLRGTNDDPIYIPAARTIVEACNRYTAPQFSIALANRGAAGQPDSVDTQAARLAFSDLFARERFRSKFNGAKRYGIIRGDWVWHVTADETKQPGSRISITAIDPSMYFVVTDPDDVDRVIGCHLVEQVTVDGDPMIRRLTYMKNDSDNVINVTDGLFAVDNWETVDAPVVKQLKPPSSLPPEITALPVYHIKNFEEPGNPFGSSEIRGFEVIMGAVNQTVSDEDLALALAGIGMYATTTPKPTDNQGNEIPWRLGPGAVVHHEPGSDWSRVAGVSSVAPYGDHYDRLMKALKESSSTPDIAIGSVDVQVASSGIALALQLGPMLAKAGEKTASIVDVHNQMFFDLLNGWFPAYEDTTFQNVSATAVVGDAVPVDRTARFAELTTMLSNKVIDTEYYRQEAAKLGYDFPPDIATRVTAEQDQFAARAATELGVAGGSGTGTTGQPAP